MKIKTLYLHDINCKGLNDEEIKLFSGFNLDTFSPTINYKNSDLDHLKELYHLAKPNFIVGSGMGGRVAYWMSNSFNTKALLYNPAIYVEDYDNLLPIPDLMDLTRYSDQIFVFGEKHSVVKREEVIKYTGNAFREVILSDLGDNPSHTHFRRGLIEAVNYIL